MAITFYPNKSIDAKPLHHGTVIYADDSCIRVKSLELFDGQGVEVLSPIFIFLGTAFGLLESSLNIFLYMATPGIALFLLKILFFRYKPNYLIFSRKSQEIYYARSPKNIIKLKWEHAKAKYVEPTSSLISWNSIGSPIAMFHLVGENQYQDKPVTTVTIPLFIMSYSESKEFWAYLQTYMKNGAKDLEHPSYDQTQEKLTHEVSRLTNKIFFKDSKFSFSDLHIHIVVWLAKIPTAIVNSNRKRTPIPNDLLPYITDNPERYGRKKSTQHPSDFI